MNLEHSLTSRLRKARLVCKTVQGGLALTFGGLPLARIDNTMLKALVRAHRWKKQLDSGRYETVQDLAEAEKINRSYIARVLRLTLLAPDIVAAILDGRQPAGMQIDHLLAPFPVEWARQRETLVDSADVEQCGRKQREPAD